MEAMAAVKVCLTERTACMTAGSGSSGLSLILSLSSCDNDIISFMSVCTLPCVLDVGWTFGLGTRLGGSGAPQNSRSLDGLSCVHKWGKCTLIAARCLQYRTLGKSGQLQVPRWRSIS